MISRAIHRLTRTGRQLACHRFTRIAFLAFIRGTAGALGAALVSLLIYWITR